MVDTGVRVTLTMVVDRANAEEFTTRFRRVAEFAAVAPGFRDQTITARDIHDENVVEFTVRSDWSDSAAFRAFETDPDQGRLTAPLAALRRSAHMNIAELPEPLAAETEGRIR